MQQYGGLYGDTSSYNTPNLYNGAQSSYGYASPAYGGGYGGPSCRPPQQDACAVPDMSRTVTIAAPHTQMHSQTVTWNTHTTRPITVPIPHTTEAVPHPPRCIGTPSNPCPPSTY